MTPSFIKSSPSPFYGGSNENNDQHHHHQFFGPNYNQAASASSYSYHFYFNPTQDQTGNYHSEVYKHQQQLEGNNYVAYEIGNKRKDHENEGEKNPGKWIMPSKMKISINQQKSLEKTRSTKMNREDQKQRSPSMETDHSSHSSTNTLIRVCSDCNTTKTPLWRSGPKGPKSLCNACGIRQRKARRALADAATASAANGTVERPSDQSTPTVKIKVQPKEKTKMNGLSTVPFKKRCKVIASGLSEDPTKKKQLGFEDYLISLSKNLAFHHVFPQDEKEGAILLMALSCGLVHTSS